MNRKTNVFLITVAATVACLGACQNRFDKDDEEKDRASRTSPAAQPPAQISFENGQAILKLDAQAQSQMGIELATLSATIAHTRVGVPAVVLSVQELATFRNGYVATQSQIEKDRVDLDVARKEYARLKMLFDNNQNVSEKTLQSAEGSLRSLEADERAAEQQLSLQEAVVEQQWGSAVAKWAIDGSPELGRVLATRDVLLQVTLSLEQNYSAPRIIPVEIPGRTRTEATLISPFPRVDARIQGRSFLYVTPAQSDLVPGINLIADLSVGYQMRGVIIPASAVVWSEGKAWTYVQTAPNQLSRHEIATDIPTDNGYFVSAGLPVGTKVVTRGAQSLLSEESVLQGYGGQADVD